MIWHDLIMGQARIFLEILIKYFFHPLCPCSMCRLYNKKKRKKLSARIFFKLFLQSNEGSTATEWNQFKQNFLSCDEIEENNYLKEKSKARILQALLSMLDYKDESNSCNFTPLWLAENIIPSLFFFLLFFLFILSFGVCKHQCTALQTNSAKAGGEPWHRGGDMSCQLSHRRNCMVPSPNMFING